MNTISVVINTHNEEQSIQDCIESAKLLTNGILVIDMEGTDKTTTMAKQRGATVISFPYSHYVEPARSFALKQCDSEWVFVLDADERITKDLAEEIQKKISNQTITYYKVPRKNMFGGKKWLQHGGWWPDYQIRLIKKSAFQGWPERIHSTPIISGNCDFLQQPIIHYFHGNLEQMVAKTVIFESIESDLLFQANKPVLTRTFFRKFFGELYRRLIKQKGYNDGVIGMIESIYQAFSKTITYLMLYEKKISRTV